MAFNVNKVSVGQVIDRCAEETRKQSDNRFTVLSKAEIARLERSKTWQVEQLRRDIHASFERSQPWYVRFGKNMLGIFSGPAGCGGDDDGGNGTHNNNNIHVDATVDASDAGDARVSTDADAGVLPYVCIEEGREGIVDDKKVLETNTYGCDVADIEHYDGKFHIVCSHPSNRLLTYVPQDNQLTENGSVTSQLQGPYGTTGDVHPSAISVFEHQDYPGQTLIGVTFQTHNLAAPTDVRGGAYLCDAQSGLQMDRADLSFKIFYGGNPEGELIMFYNPVGSLFAQGKLWIAPENRSPAVDDYVTSMFLGFTVVRDGSVFRFSREEGPVLGSPSTSGYRPAGVARMDDAVVACSFGGVAAPLPADAQPPMIAFFDTSSTASVLTAVRSLGLNLDSTWQLTALPRIGMSDDKKHFVVAAENPAQQQRMIAVLTLANPDDLANTTHAVHTFDITQYAKGRVKSVLVDGTRVYVTEEGDPNATVDRDKFGTMIVLDIDPSSGNLTFKHQIPLGILPRAASLDPVTGKIYQPVTQANCKAADTPPYLMEIDPSQVPGLQ